MAKEEGFSALMPERDLADPTFAREVNPERGWRAAAIELRHSVQDVIKEAREVDPDSWPLAGYLLLDAGEIAAEMQHIAQDVNAKAYDILNPVYHMGALLTGVCEMKETPRAVRLLLAAPIEQLDKSSDLFDVGGLPDEGVSVGYQVLSGDDEFTAGMNLAADMFAEGYSIGDHPSIWLKAEMRDGEAHNVFVRRYFDAVEGVPAKREGFMAALSQFIATAETMTLVPDAYRVTRDAYLGAQSPEAKRRQRSGSVAVPPTSHAADEATFMAGKALVAEMVGKAQAISEAGSDQAALEAAYRGRGVPQDVFTRPYIEAVAADEKLRTGFCAALASVLQQAGSAMDGPSTIRSITFKEWTGGPDVKYTAEQDEESDSADPLNRTINELERVLREASVVGADVAGEEIGKARDALFHAKNELSVDASREYLNEVRAHVHDARTYGMPVNDTEASLKTKELLLQAHRRLNEYLGGFTAEDRPEGGTPLGLLLARIDDMLDGCEHVDGSEGTYELISKSAKSSKRYWEALAAWDRGDEAEALRKLPELRSDLEAAIGECAKYEVRAVLGRSAVALLDEFLGGASKAQVTASTSQPAWRSEALRLLESVTRNVDDALEIAIESPMEWGNGPFALLLLRRAEAELEAFQTALHHEGNTDLLGRANDLQALLVGARDMTLTTDAFKMKLDVGATILAHLVGVLDRPDGGDAASPSAPPASSP